MRSLRPPPKVTPPKPPAHLFEPREEVPPVKMNNSSTKPYDFEDDVKFQMQQLENEMKMMLAGKDKGGIDPPSYSAPSDRHSYSNDPQEPARINPSDWKAKGFPSEFAYMKASGQLDIKPSPLMRDSRDATYGQQPQNKQQLAPDPYPARINPSDWKAKGFPSEFAYMKATGQLDLKPEVPQFHGSMNPRTGFDPVSQPPAVNPRTNSDLRDQYEKQLVSPARRKGGAMQNLYVEEDNLRRKFANQHNYSEQLEQQVSGALHCRIVSLSPPPPPHLNHITLFISMLYRPAGCSATPGPRGRATSPPRRGRRRTPTQRGAQRGDAPTQ